MEAASRPGRIFQRFEVLVEVGSTNDHLKQFAQAGVARVVRALSQTAGRGRYGRSWHSPAGQGLYVSYLFYPRWDAREVELLSVVPSLAVMSLIRSLNASVAVRVKRPNDVLVGNQKVAGILADSSVAGSEIEWAIVGVGLNVRQTSFPAELSNATSLVREGIAVDDLTELCRLLTGRMEERILAAESGDRIHLYQEYERETV